MKLDEEILVEKFEANFDGPLITGEEEPRQLSLLSSSFPIPKCSESPFYLLTQSFHSKEHQSPSKALEIMSASN